MKANERRRRLLTRALPIVLVAIAAFVVGLIAGSSGSELEGAKRFAVAWQRGNLAAMHRELSDASARRFRTKAFERAYDDAETTATIDSVVTGTVESAKTPSGGDAAAFPVTFDTHAFGRLEGRMVLPLDGGKVDWDPSLVFPGLRRGQRLERRTRIPPRAPILARNGTPLAEGPATARTSPLGSAALTITGTMGRPRGKRIAEQKALGFPPTTEVGTSGLELAFNERLEGHPGGQLLAVGGGRTKVLASTKPIPGQPVHTTISPSLQKTAVIDLGSTYGGAAVLDAKTGSVLALAGIAFSGPQPPGSTFKLVTTTAALDAGIVKPTDQFPIETHSVVGGRSIDNANGEACGGSFVQAFAESCNSVFTPLGPKIGSDRLVRTAEGYGFNSPPSLYDDAALAAVDPAQSTIPKHITTAVDLAVSAIGQGEVLATPLEMAAIAQTIANGGTRDPNAIVSDKALGPSQKPVRVTSAKTAATMRRLMLGVVRFGTGTAAQIPGVEVAGKTGTAELGPVAGAKNPEQQRVDAWFTCFAPASSPKLVVAVMVVNANGAGGEVAAPIAQQILASGLGAG